MKSVKFNGVWYNKTMDYLGCFQLVEFKATFHNKYLASWDSVPGAMLLHLTEHRHACSRCSTFIMTAVRCLHLFDGFACIPKTMVDPLMLALSSKWMRNWEPPGSPPVVTIDTVPL